LGIFAFFTSVYCISGRPSYFYIKRPNLLRGILLALITVDVALGALWGQYMWIDHRNYPGGPLGYFAASEAAWFNVLGLAASTAANILGDGLLVCLIFS
jgi:hypothetical protein